MDDDVVKPSLGSTMLLLLVIAGICAAGYFGVRKFFGNGDDNNNEVSQNGNGGDGGAGNGGNANDPEKDPTGGTSTPPGDTDSTAPSVTIKQSDAQADPTNEQPIRFTVVFSEPVTGFANDDVTLGGTAGASSATVEEVPPNDGTTFEVSVEGATADGIVVASLQPGAATDKAGNQSSTAGPGDNEVTYDSTAPTATIEPGDGQANPSQEERIRFKVTFDEPVTGFSTEHVALEGTAGATGVELTEIPPGDGTTFEIAATGMSKAGTVVSNVAPGITDAAGNASAAATPAEVIFEQPSPGEEPKTDYKPGTDEFASFRDDAFLRIDQAPENHYPRQLKELAKEAIENAKALKLLAKVNFATGMTSLSSANEEALEKAFKGVEGLKEFTVVLIGLSDNTKFRGKTQEESDFENWMLSQARAEGVKDFLQGKGVVPLEEEKIQIVGLGATELLSSDFKDRNRGG